MNEVFCYIYYSDRENSRFISSFFSPLKCFCPACPINYVSDSEMLI